MSKKSFSNKRNTSLEYIPVIVVSLMAIVLSAHVVDTYHNKSVLGERVIAQSGNGRGTNSGPSENTGRGSERQRIKVEELDENEELKTRIRNEKVELKREGSKVITTLEEEDDVVNEIESDGVLDEVNQELEEKDVTISTSAGGLAIQKGKVKAKTGFPLSINPVTGELTVTTPAGSKIVTVLPDSAVQNLLRHKKITVLGSEENEPPEETPEDPVATESPQLDDETSTESSQLATTEIELTTLNNEAVFKIKGVTKKKILGIVSHDFDKTAYVSAETGEVVDVEQTFFSKMLEFLSF